MVTFLVCLVVVGGAVVAILRLTLDEGRQPATDADGASRGRRADRLAGSVRRASAFLVPGGSASGGERARDGSPPARPRPMVPPGGGMTVGSVALAQAALARADTEPVAGTDAAADLGAAPATSDTVPAAGTDPEGELEASPAPSDTVAGARTDPAAAPDVAPATSDTEPVARTDPAAEADAAPATADTVPGVDVDSLTAPEAASATMDTVPVAIADAGPALGAASLGMDPSMWSDVDPQRSPDPLPGETTSTSDTTGPDATVAEPAPGEGRPTGRRARPSFGRRVLRRLRGATGLVVLLVALGALLAVTFAAVTAMLIIGVRAAVGT